MTLQMSRGSMQGCLFHAERQFRAAMSLQSVLGMLHLVLRAAQGQQFFL